MRSAIAGVLAVIMVNVVIIGYIIVAFREK
jgi:hypothetical protein